MEAEMSDDEGHSDDGDDDDANADGMLVWLLMRSWDSTRGIQSLWRLGGAQQCQPERKRT